MHGEAQNRTPVKSLGRSYVWETHVTRLKELPLQIRLIPGYRSHRTSTETPADFFSEWEPIH